MSTLTPSLFNLTLTIIHETERRVLTFRSFGPIPDEIIRILMFPFPFIQLGMAELFRPVSKGAFMWFGLLILATSIVSHAELSEQTKSNIFLACPYVPIFLVAFAIPSTFALDSIKNEQIQSLADYIYSLGINSNEKLETFEENLSNIAERTYARTKTLQWFIATLWALFLYGFNLMNNIALKIAPEQITKIISDSITTFIIYGVVSFFSILVIFSHKKANDAVFRRLQLTIQELKYRAVVNHPSTI
ncbi:MAG: hypothetical protein PHY16_19625 [Methylobacter sp.]|nr:hypothetical protein [Methylobacter sp.]